MAPCYPPGMPRIRTQRAPEPSPTIVPHIYRDFDPGGYVLPHKRYTLDLPESAASAVAAHVAVIPDHAAAYDGFRIESATVHDGHLHVEFHGRGVISGISVLFHVPA